MPVDLPKGLMEKARQEAAEFRESDSEQKGSERASSSEAERSSDEGSKEESEGKDGVQEYEFTVWEDRILEVVMEAMRMAGLALAVRAIATFCLGAHLQVFLKECNTASLCHWQFQEYWPVSASYRRPTETFDTLYCLPC